MGDDRLDAAARRAILDGLDESVIVTDPSGAIRRWNRAAERIFGYSADEMIGRSIGVLHHDRSEAELAGDLAAIREGHARRGEWMGRSADGRTILLRARTQLLRDEHGRPIGFLWVASDVTGGKTLERALASSEARVRIATLASTEAIRDWDLETDRVTWNDAALALFGYEREHESDLEWWSDRVHPADRARVLEALRAVIARGEGPWREEYRFRRASGAWADVVERGYVATTRGRPVRMIGAMQDVTERRRASAIASFLSDVSGTLGSSHEYERTLSELAARAVPSIADWCSVDVRERNGYRRIAVAHAEPEHAEHVDALMRFAPESDPEHPTSQALALGRPVLIDRPHARTRISGTPELAEVHAALGVRSFLSVPIVLADGPLAAINFVLAGSGRVFRDADRVWATELARRAATAISLARSVRERDELLAQAEEASRAKDEFLAMLGHELRNPLSPIRTALELMRMREPEVFARERAIVERQVSHMVRLVDDLLDVSRIARGRIELRRGPVDLADVVADAIEAASALLERQQHAMHVKVPRGLILDADRDRLRQVLSNLLTNAAKYTDAGGAIEVLAERRGDEVSVRVIDDGRGIDPELLPRVFELFAQGRRAFDRSEGGLGLGLAIARSVVELHGGRIEARSDGAGLGSTFELHLPLAAPARPSAPSPSISTRPTSERAGARVLVVDDNSDAAEMLADALEIRGYATDVAHDGPSALAMVDENDFDAALLDLGLPVMDGFELARKLRERRGPPVLIAVTGYGQPSDRASSRAAGFDEHVVKPVALDEIDVLLRRRIAQARGRGGPVGEDGASDVPA
ncbi:MAG: PAS domain S-box protein [Myxococcota bacterium]|nr:PAS domain S-box protein [Myxococcota bacterium]